MVSEVEGEKASGEERKGKKSRRSGQNRVVEASKSGPPSAPPCWSLSEALTIIERELQKKRKRVSRSTLEGRTRRTNDLSKLSSNFPLHFPLLLPASASRRKLAQLREDEKSPTTDLLGESGRQICRRR